MALVETQPSARQHAGHGTKKVASLAPHGGGRVATPAARGFRQAIAQAFENSVWAPLLVKACAVLAGMLALAAIGASSIARGSGVAQPPPSAPPAPRLAQAAVTPFVEPPDAGASRPVTDAGAEAGTPPSDAITADGKVVLNRAGMDELRRIPGVGPKRAQAIVELRTKLGGRFKRLGDLLRVKGIGVRSLKKMEAYVVLDAKTGV
jgi:competence protein ComEA